MKAIRFCGPSNEGKTTTILDLISELKQRKKRIAVIKHSHHNILFPEKKDSTRFFSNGADYSLVLGENAANLTIPKTDKTPDEWIEWLFPDAEIVLIEGWRKHSIPTILICKSKPPVDWILPEPIIGYIGWCPDPSVNEFKSILEIADFLESRKSTYP
jgi:molybdopterin-guanine dinucleotide biosynthesis protein MobB